MPDKDMQELYNSFGFNIEPVNNEYPIIDLVTHGIILYHGFLVLVPSYLEKRVKIKKVAEFIEFHIKSMKNF